MSIDTLSYATTWDIIMDIVSRVSALREGQPLPVILSSLPELPDEGLDGPPVSVIQGPPGRNISLAIGLKAAKPDLPLLLIMNADGITLGTNHLIHAARRNFDMTLLLLRSEITERIEPERLDRMRWGTMGLMEELETVATPLEWAKAMQASLVGRGSLFEPDQLAQLVSTAIGTPGFSLIGVTGGADLELGVLARNEFPEYFKSYREWSESFRDLAKEIGAGPKIKPVTPKSEVRRYEVRICGLGGHGVKLAGTVLSEAAGIHEGLWATHRGEYGSATRGGPSMVDVVFGRQRVSYPGADHPNLLVVLSQQASDLYSHRVKKGGYLIADPDQVENMPENALSVPIVKLARESVGAPIAAGVVSLGCVAALSNVVSLEALRESVLKKVPVRFQQKNLAALESGYEATREAAGITG